MRKRILESVRHAIEDSDYDSLLIAGTQNIQYLTGFRGDNGFVIISPSQALLLTNQLYIEDARAAVDGPYDVIEMRESLSQSIQDFGSAELGNRLGFEHDKTTVASYTKLIKTLPDCVLVPTESVIEGLRISKDEHEIEAVRKAQTISERVFDEVLGLVGEGVEERELAMEIDYRFRLHGGEGPSFATIVATGRNTSKPHYVPSRNKIKTGDFVLFDMGTIVDSYASDMTRTIVFGSADSEQKKVYKAVLDAQTAALEVLKAGMACSEADHTARDVIDQAGYGEQFVHSLGHGVGLEVHEQPYLSKRSTENLVSGSIVTVEPGIYLPGWGGVRIEDMVVIRENGIENLVTVPKEFIEL
ncbi:M24 family metallopeptidase [Candidatus Latescibacterota bacterium]